MASKRFWMVKVGTLCSRQSELECGLQCFSHAFSFISSLHHTHNVPIRKTLFDCYRNEIEYFYLLTV